MVALAGLVHITQLDLFFGSDNLPVLKNEIFWFKGRTRKTKASIFC